MINEQADGVSVSALRFTYPGAAAATLSGLDLHIKKGSFTCLIGPSGCGKSTLLRLIAGLERPDSGVICCGGVNVTGPGQDRDVVFQSPALFPWLNARDNVAFAIRKTHRALSRAMARDMAEAALCRVGLADAQTLFPSQLSGGMAQRVAIARALSGGGSTLLLDEPFSSLDPKNRMALQELLLGLWEDDRKTVLFITHDIDEALLLGDSVAFLAPGGICARYHVNFPRPRRRETLLVSPQCCTLRKQLISLFYKWGEAAEVLP